VSGPAGAALAAGVLVDGFRLERELPGGAAAALWRVTHPDCDFPLVLKVPRDDSDEASAIVRFQVEQLLLPKLGGPHVPRFVASGDVAQLPYLVTELVAGTSLHERIDAEPFSGEEVARLGVKMADALQDLHCQHAIHLDLKPRSVIFRKRDEVVLVDFGLASHVQLPDLIAEQFRQPLGTAAYMAPEQVLLIRTDHRSDLFALGAILYQMIAGRPPFGSPDNAAGLRRRLFSDPVAPRQLNPSCPAWLQEVILGCLEVDPAGRYQDAGQVAALLKNPTKVQITRGAGKRPGRFITAITRRLPGRQDRAAALADAARQRERVPTVLAAVDLSPDAEPLAEALRSAVRRTYEYRRAVRLACVTVRTLLKVGVVDASVDHAGRNVRVQRLAALKHWALPLGLPAERVSFHVLESDDPAAALVEYARENRVDHVVIGARGDSALRRLLGSVSARVVAEAPCTVTVVRTHYREAGGAAPADRAP
jgi:nucleotide-binding universal stress UspA family protein